MRRAWNLPAPYFFCICRRFFKWRHRPRARAAKAPAPGAATNRAVRTKEPRLLRLARRGSIFYCILLLGRRDKGLELRASAGCENSHHNVAIVDSPALRLRSIRIIECKEFAGS